MLHKNKLIAKILLCMIIIQVIQPIVSTKVFADTNTEQTTEEVGTEYEIKATEEWDVSAKGDGSVTARWNRSDRSLRITGTGEMKNGRVVPEKYQDAVEKVVIEKDVTSIGSSAFSGCSSLENITVAEGNENYESIEGVLFNKEKTEIINYPKGKKDISYQIPEGVTSIGDGEFRNCISLVRITIPSSVTGIGNDAFEGCSSLENITIPSSVKSIGDTAFYDCNNLQSITVADGNENYESENGILFNNGKTEIIKYPAGKKDIAYQIPEGVTSIRYREFRNCSSLTSITIPDSVNTIKNSAFRDCSLRNIEIPASVTKIATYDVFPSKAILYVAKNSEGHKYAEEHKQGYILNEQENIETDIKVGTEYEIKATKEWDDVSKNNDGTVKAKWNRSDRSLTITGTGEMKSWEYNSKDDWHEKYISAIEKVVIGEGVKSIGDYAFYRCSNLKSITIPSTVTSIGSYAFSGCSSLQNITVAEGNEKYQSIDGVLFNKGKTEIIKYPEGKEDISYQIPKGVTSIGEKAFYDCSSLKELIIPEGITSIGKNAVNFCYNLISIYFPKSIETMEYGVLFDYCNRLQSINVAEGNENYESIDGILFNKGKTEIIKYPEGKKDISYQIPEGVTSIGPEAFYDCSILKRITIPSTVTNIESIAPGTKILYVTKNSAGHKYAEEHKKGYIIVVYKGDVNQDGKIDTTDLTKILRHIAAQNNGEIAQKYQNWILKENQVKAADIKEDGIINITDLTKMLRHLAAQNNNEIKQKYPDWII